jgi:hypothetical protein
MKQMDYSASGLAIIAVVYFLLVSCNKIVDEKLSIDKTELTFTQKDERKEFLVSCEGEEEWRFEAEGLERYFGGNMADVRDFTVEPVSGKGKTRVFVTLRNEPVGSYTIDLKAIGKNNQVIIKLKIVDE